MSGWHSFIFWVKIGLLMVTIAWTGVVLQVDPSEYVKPEQDNDSVKAAAFAIGAAVSLFIPFFNLRASWIPNSAPDLLDPLVRAVDAVARLVGAIAALLAGWYWLDSSIDGAMAPLLSSMVIAVSALTVLGLSGPAVSSLSEWVKRKWGNRRN